MNETKKTSAINSLRQVIISFFYLLIYPSLVFLLSGDWHWAEGWIFSIGFCSLSFAIVLYLFFKDPALLNERFGSPFQKEQKFWDKILIAFVMLGFLLWFVMMPLDAKRFGWSPPFPLWLKIIGSGFFVFGFVALFAALK